MLACIHGQTKEKEGEGRRRGEGRGRGERKGKGRVNNTSCIHCMLLSHKDTHQLCRSIQKELHASKLITLFCMQNVLLQQVSYSLPAVHLLQSKSDTRPLSKVKEAYLEYLTIGAQTLTGPFRVLSRSRLATSTGGRGSNMTTCLRARAVSSRYKFEQVIVYAGLGTDYFLSTLRNLRLRHLH